jgi:hypothetical protein
VNMHVLDVGADGDGLDERPDQVQKLHDRVQ